MAISVLSDVHVGQEIVAVNEIAETVLTRYIFRTTQDITSQKADQYEKDEDGDLVLPRNECIVICLGLQVWRGALLMADFLLSNKELLKNKTVLELGGGVGLCSILVSRFCHSIICTDFKTSILDVCRRNTKRNRENFEGKDNIVLKQLDWTAPFASEKSSNYGWSAKDMEELKSTSIVIASDVIYEDHLTDAFLSCLILLHCEMICHLSVVYLALEKRFNFTLEELAPAVPAYSYFRKCLDKTYEHNKQHFMFEASEIATCNVPLCSRYDRVKEMEIWKLTIKLIKT